MIARYPFTAIVGQDLLKTALLLCGIDQSIGGVLIRGDKGTAKSTAARGLAELLPDIATVSGCQFNCDIAAPAELCTTCVPDRQPHFHPVPFVNLPIGATEDRVVGTLDLEKALQHGQQSLRPGLLASAHRGILYIDEVNLLPDHLVDVLLDSAAMSTNTVQREGLSVSHPAKFSLIGTMNPEEGDLRPQLLDRFGMMVEVKAPDNARERTEVVRRRLQFENNPTNFIDEFKDEQLSLRATVRHAIELLPSVKLSDELLLLISTVCCEMQIVSLRADITMTKVVRALAALDGRVAPGPEDVRSAARLVLAHRRRLNPLDKTGIDEHHLDEICNNQSQSPPPRLPESQAEEPYDPTQEQFDPDKPDPDAAQQDEEEDNTAGEFNDAESDRGEMVFAPIGATTLAARVQIRDTANGGGRSGRRSTVMSGKSGQYIRAVADANPTNLALDATIRHALLQGREEFSVKKEDLHAKVMSEKRSTLVILMVDASGSMAAMRRMEAVKGTALALLADAYQKRDQVCVISFRGEKAELVMQPTRSLDVANEKLKQLPTGGRTPLADALRLGCEIALKERTGSRVQPLLVLLTDGRGNVSIKDGTTPADSSRLMAGVIAEHGFPSIVVDTEDGFVRSGAAKEIAREMGAECIALDRLSAESLTMTIRTHIGRGN